MEIKIGCHVSGAGGLWNAPINAGEFKCEAFQIFSRSPQGGPVKPIDDETAEKFKAEMKSRGFDEFVIHAPYILNFGSGKPSTYHGSISIVRGELERGSILGAKYVMFHTGSGKDLGRAKALAQAKEGIKKVLDGYKGTTKLLLENAAGAGEILGDSFEELASLSDPIKKHPAFGGFCYDTQHGFASGYDIRTPEAVVQTFKKFDKVLGLEHLAMFQINDSKTELNSHKDRHEHISDGLIGTKGFKALIDYLKANSSKLKTSSMLLILETEHDKVELDLKKLKDLRNKSK